MTIKEFKIKLRNTPSDIAFSDTINVIEEHYNFAPTAFSNGSVENAAGKNSGSCKIFAFAQKQSLTKDETLSCFGAYYFEEVLKDPNGNGHQNIRNFMKTGFEGITFKDEALTEK